MIISVIIPSYNQGKYIGDTLRSLELQHDSGLEIIVMDGGSTDETLDVIKRYSHIISYWQSCKDGGQSAAINAGFKRASGEFVVWLNTDDIMMPNAIGNLREAIRRHPQCKWFCGSMLWMNPDGIITRVGKQERMGRLFPSTYFVSAGPSAFLHRSLIQDNGILLEDFHYIMDLELWYRLASMGLYMERIKGYTWAMRVHSESKTTGRFSSNDESYKRHEMQIQKERERLMAMYPNRTIYQASKKFKAYYWLNKIFDRSIMSHLMDRRLIGVKVMDLFSKEL